MKGKLHKKINGDWVVLKVSQEPQPCDTIVKHGIEYLLHPNDVKQIQEDSQRFDNIEARIATYPDVECEIVEVYNKNNQVGYRYVNYAKLIYKETSCEYSGLPAVTSYIDTSYPELEGTINLCNDKIWDEINHDYSSEQYPAFGGPFTDSISLIDWLKQNYKAPERK